MCLARFATVLISLSTIFCGVASAQTMWLPEPVGMTGNPAARSVLVGNAAFLRGDLQEASARYRAALRRKPDFAVAFFNLGLVELHEGQRSRGLSDMDRGIELASAHGMGAAYTARLRAMRAMFTMQRGTT